MELPERGQKATRGHASTARARLAEFWHFILEAAATVNSMVVVPVNA